MTALIKSRQGYKLQISNEYARIKNVIEANAPPDLKILHRVHNKIRGYLDLLLELDGKIMDRLTEVTAIDQEVENAQQYNNDWLETLMIIQEKIDELTSPPPTLPRATSVQPSQVVGGGTSGSRTVTGSRVRLPKLSIPQFSGKFLEFRSFMDMFKATVDNNQTLSISEKFCYLMESLEGDARALVEGFDMSDANYVQIVELLEERFGDVQRAKFGHFEELVAVKPATLHSADLVRVLYACERHIRSLVALGVSETEFAIAFVPLVLAKLPTEVRREVWTKNGDDEWTMGNLRTYLKAIIKARERGDASSAALNAFAESGDAARLSDQKTKSHRSTVLVADTKRKDNLKRAKKCRYCTETSHWSDQCRKFETSDARKSQLRASNLCFSCLDSGNRTSNCPNQHPCYYCKKTGHHRSLCFDKFGRSKKDENVNLNPEAPCFIPNEAVQQCSANVAVAQRDEHRKCEVSFLPTASTTFSNSQGDRRHKGRVLMDTASSKSFVTEEVANKLRLPIIEESYVSVGRFGSDKRTTVKTKRVELKVECRDGTFLPLVAGVTPVISTPVTRFPIDPSQYPVIKQLPLAEPLNDRVDELPVDVLIGTDYFHDFVTPQSVIKCNDGPVLVGSRFGFLTAGRMGTKDNASPESTLVLALTESAPGRRDPYDRFDIERFWQLEAIGTKIKEKDLSMDISDEQALENFYATLKFDKGRYWVTWPWKSSNPALADNKRLAFARLKNTFERLKRNPELLQTYDDIIQKQRQLNVVEEAPKTPTGPVYYVPHHEVVTPSKTTTKVRIVYDASSKARKDDLSLNDCMHRGKVILEDLCGLLIRFRTKRIGIVADIEKAFLQIGLQETERDVARFFWVKDIHKTLTPENITILRFTRVYFGCIASPSLLGSTLDAHARKIEASSKDEVVRVMAREFRENIYSDNHIGGEDDEKLAARHCQEVKKLCQGASMNLREFYTNSDAVRESIAAEDRGTSATTKVLGVIWHLPQDTLQCVGLKSGSTEAVVPTKRSIVSEVGRVFDPCGWFAPVTVTAKALIQNLWKKGIGWDDRVDGELALEWSKVQTELQRIPEIEIPRCCPDPHGENQLHAFCDASQKAASAVIYWRKGSGQNLSSDLVFAKTRVAPLDPRQTIPRMELIAVELGAALLEFVEEHLKRTITRRIIWSDSQCVLAWLQNERLTTKFVQARVEKIRSVPNLEFHYVRSSENPADLPSRGCSVDFLKKNDKWWHGPEWLLQDSSSWPPAFPPQEEVRETSEPENVIVAVETKDKPTYVTIPFWMKNYSNLDQLLRVTARIYRVCRNFKKPREQREKGWNPLVEWTKARTLLNGIVQRQAFPNNGKEFAIWLKSSPVRKLNVYIDPEGILRCKGRLGKSELPADTKDPVLLPKNYPFTELVIRHAHKKALHAGTEHTLAEVRKEYWIIDGRQQVKKVRDSYHRCRLLEGGAYATPPPPQLPEIRVSQKTPFAYTGIDYFGPLTITVDIASNVKKKVWVCLFTCALIRAVHLEVVEDQSAQEFQLALRRFFALYGTPLVIVSDNASQFRTVEEAMRRLSATSEALGTVATGYGIVWHKIPENAPWMGGFFERMVGLVKRFVKKALHGVAATLSQFRTVIAEVTFVVNSRPLLYVEDEVSTYTLCPRDFLGRASRPGFPTYEESQEKVPKSTVGNVVECWKRLQSMSTNFWTMWRDAYLTSLREKHANVAQRGRSALLPSEDSIVLIKDKMPRSVWKRGLITGLIPSRDGKVRSATLRLDNHQTITRPIKLLYPLEMGSSDGKLPLPARTGSDRLTDDDDDDNGAFDGFSQGSITDARERVARATRAIARHRPKASRVGGGPSAH